MRVDLLQIGSSLEVANCGLKFITWQRRSPLCAERLYRTRCDHGGELVEQRAGDQCERVRGARRTLDKHKQRDDGIFAAVRDGQHSLTSIAEEVGLSIASIGRIVKKLEAKNGNAKRKT